MAGEWRVAMGALVVVASASGGPVEAFRRCCWLFRGIEHSYSFLRGCTGLDRRDGGSRGGSRWCRDRRRALPTVLSYAGGKALSLLHDGGRVHAFCGTLAPRLQLFYWALSLLGGVFGTGAGRKAYFCTLGDVVFNAPPAISDARKKLVNNDT